MTRKPDPPTIADGLRADGARAERQRLIESEGGDMRREHRRDIRAEERAAIVSWLRCLHAGEGRAVYTLDELADAIEAGEYTKGGADMILGSISVMQAIDVWTDIVEAYHGVNGYGGNTAEIYLYRLAEYSPSGVDYRAANERLHDLLRVFADRYDAVVTLYATRAHDGRGLGSWLTCCEESHRHHVRIRRRGASRVEGPSTGDKSEGEP